MDLARAFLEKLVSSRERAVITTNSATALFFLWLLARKNGGVKKSLIKLIFGAVKFVPGAKGAIDKEKSSMVEKMEKMIIGEQDDSARILALPAQGMAQDELTKLLNAMGGADTPKWTGGRVSGAVYHGGDDLTEVATVAFRNFAWTNPLHPDVFPSVRKMEAEVVRMNVQLFGGDISSDCCGAMTSGGTESILMACKAYRDWACEERGVTEPEMVVPSTAHAAFDKACGYFGIKLVQVPVDPKTFRADVPAMKKAVNRNTIMLVGSAPCFPQGVVDPIADLAAFARDKGIGMHVDCCLGSLLIPFAKRLGYPIPDFDFRVEGVTSISADTHKYGFAPKGTSVIMYSSPEWRKWQYFVQPDWSGGIYASPTIAGSRPGALIAGAWATMMYIGEEGYLRHATEIMEAARHVAQGLGDIPEIRLFGQPDLSVVAFGPREGSRINIFNVGDAMTARGWNLNTLQFPASIHVCVTHTNAAAVQANFLDDLRAAVHEVVTAPPGKFKDGMGAMYGMAESIPDRSMVDDLARAFLDVLYKA